MLLSTSRHNIEARILEPFARPFSIERVGPSLFWIAEFQGPWVTAYDETTQQRSLVASSSLQGLWRGPHSITRGPDDQLTIIDYRANCISIHSPLSGASCTLVDSASGLTAGPATATWHHDELYISDYGSNRIVVIDKAGIYQREISSANSPSRQPGAFDRLHDITFFEDSMVIVDTWNSRLQRFTLQGEFIEIIAFEFSKPVSISKSLKNIAVSDVGSHRIYLFDLKFNLVNTIGIHNELLKPYEVRFRGSDLSICDTDHNRILILDTKDLEI